MLQSIPIYAGRTERQLAGESRPVVADVGQSRFGVGEVRRRQGMGLVAPCTDYTWKEFKDAVGWGPDHKLAREAYDGARPNTTRKAMTMPRRNSTRPRGAGPTPAWKKTPCFSWPNRTSSPTTMQAQDSYTNLLKAHDNTRYLDTVMARCSRSAPTGSNLTCNRSTGR